MAISFKFGMSALRSVSSENTLRGTGVDTPASTTVTATHSTVATVSYPRTGETTVTATHTATTTVSYQVSGSTTVTATHDAVPGKVHAIQDVRETVTATHAANQHYVVTVNHTVTVTHDAKGAEPANTTVTATHVASAAGSIYVRTGETTVTTTHSANEIFDATASTTVTATHLAERTKNHTAATTVTGTHDAVGQVIKPATHTVTATHDVTRAAINFTRTGETTVTSTHTAVGFKAIAPCDNYSAGLGTRTQFTLQHPTVSPTLTVNLRVPKFGNNSQFRAQVKIKRTLAGFPRPVRKTTWPKVEVNQYSFEALTETQRNDLHTFFDSTVGKKIKVTDHDNVVWEGYILDPILTTQQDGIGCQYGTKFSFRGVRT